MAEHNLEQKAQAAPRDGKFKTFAKPFAITWRARAYFTVAFAFWIIALVVHAAFGVPPAAPWWVTAVLKMFGSFDKIAYVIFFAGIVYAVLSEAFDYAWNTNIQGEVRRGYAETGRIFEAALLMFVKGLVGISFEAVKVWVEGGRAQPEQIKAIGVASLKAYYGPHQNSPGSLLEFFLEDVIEPVACASGQVCESFATTITIGASNVPDHFSWEEQRHYTVYCESGICTHPLKLDTSYKVQSEHLRSALDATRYTMTVAGTEAFNFGEWWAAHQKEIRNGAFKISDKGATLDYDGMWVRLTFSEGISITKQRTHIVVYERSLISVHDRCHGLLLRYPRKDLRATYRIEVSGWVVKPPVASAIAYSAPSRDSIGRSGSGQSASITVPGWTLPGFALLTEWAPE